MKCCNANGWIMEDGMVMDRCQKCNPRPIRIRPWLERNWLWVFPVGMVSAVAVLEIAGLFLFLHR